jgi:hypothetical protein
MYVAGVDQQHFEAALLEDLVERDPIDPSRLQRHSLHSALREPVRQPVKLGGEGAELTHRLGVPVGRDRHEMAVLSAIDSSRIGLDPFE